MLLPSVSVCVVVIIVKPKCDIIFTIYESGNDIRIVVQYVFLMLDYVRVLYVTKKGINRQKEESRVNIKEGTRENRN
jgi:hypothetical protein